MHTRTGRRSYLVLIQLIVAVFLMTGVAQATNVGAQFVHYATVDNVASGTFIHHPLTDGKPLAIVHATQSFNPPGIPGTDNDGVIAVQYTAGGLWAIINQDDSYMPVGAAFNIWIPPVDASTFVHTATAGNINGNYTYIDSPLTNNNPTALLRMTPNWNPGGGGGYYNNSVTGVFYSLYASKWAVFNQDSVAMPVGVSFNITVLPDDPTAFVHTATSANTNSMWTTIDNPLTNNNPSAIVSITQNWNPGGFGGTYNNHPVGVYYIGSKWAIFNRDHANIPIQAAFNVLVPSSESALFVHSADPGNSYNQMTFIDNPLANNNPNAIVSVTQNWNPGGGGGVFNNHALGVLYNYSRSTWAVFNQDLAAMPEGASFNVSIPAVDASTFVHGTFAENINLNWTTIDHPLTNGNPDAIVHVTQNWDASGIGGVYNDHNIGVWYDGLKWAIFNQDLAAMPEGAAFNVSIPAVDDATFVHTAAAGNIFGNSTVFHHPLADGNPFAVIRVTQNWNPGDGTGLYNDRQIGVAYTGADWSVFNQDGANMPEGVSFNVTVAAPIIFSNGFESGDMSAWTAAVP